MVEAVWFAIVLLQCTARRARWYGKGSSAIIRYLSCDVIFTTIYKHVLSFEVVPYI